MKQHNNITLIGLGQMGTQLAKSLLANGHRITVWNRSVQKALALEPLGAAVAGSLAEALTLSDLILICLSTYDDVYTQLKPLSAVLKDKTIINLSSGNYDEDQQMAAWAQTVDASYLSGAAMSGVLLVGQPEALFIYGGSSTAFEDAKPYLHSFGKAVYLGENAGHTSLYDTAMFGVIWGALSAYFHGTALLGKKGIAPLQFAETAAGHLSFISYLMIKYARHIEEGRFDPDEGTLRVHAGAMDILLQSSKDAGISTAFPTHALEMIERGIAVAGGEEGVSAAYKGYLEPEAVL